MEEEEEEKEEKEEEAKTPAFLEHKNWTIVENDGVEREILDYNAIKKKK